MDSSFNVDQNGQSLPTQISREPLFVMVLKGHADNLIQHLVYHVEDARHRQYKIHFDESDKSIRTMSTNSLGNETA